MAKKRPAGRSEGVVRATYKKALPVRVSRCLCCLGLGKIHLPSALTETVATLDRVSGLRSGRRVCSRILAGLVAEGLL